MSTSPAGLRCRWSTTCTRPRRYGQWCRPHWELTVHAGGAGWVDAAPVAAHLRALRDLGWTHAQIGRAGVVGDTVPRDILTGRYRSVRVATATALLGVPLRRQRSMRGCDATGTRRMVAALAWMGHPAAAVAGECGVTGKSLSTMLARGWVSYALAAKVTVVYARWWDVPGPSRLARQAARQRGYAPPAAWDEDTIHDPNATPRGVRDTAATMAA